MYISRWNQRGWALPLSLKSSTRMISAIRLSGVRLIILCIVRKREVQPSLWNGIITLVFGSFSRYTLCLQLEREGHKLYKHTEKSELANTAIHSGRSTTMVSGIKPNSVINQYFHVTRTSSFRIFILLTTYNKSEKWQNLSTPTAIRFFSFTESFFLQNERGHIFYNTISKKQTLLWSFFVHSRQNLWKQSAPPRDRLQQAAACHPAWRALAVCETRTSTNTAPTSHPRSQSDFSYEIERYSAPWLWRCRRTQARNHKAPSVFEGKLCPAASRPTSTRAVPVLSLTIPAWTPSRIWAKPHSLKISNGLAIQLGENSLWTMFVTQTDSISSFMFYWKSGKRDALLCR